MNYHKKLLYFIESKERKTVSNKILYSRNEIKSFTVKDLKEEFESNLPIDSDAFLSSKTYSLIVSIVQTILKKGWTQIEFREYKEKESTGQFLGSEQVWSGTLAAVSEVYLRYVTPNNNKKFTTNGLEELILKYPDEDKIEKHLIKELHVNCRRAIVSVYKESATRQISDNVYNRVVNVASEVPFVYNTTEKTIKLTGYKCKKENIFINLRAAISSATLKYGTNYALETEELKDILIKAICTSNGILKLDEFMKELRERIQFWLVNNPYDVSEVLENLETNKLSQDIALINQELDSDSKIFNFFKQLDEQKKKSLYLMTLNKSPKLDSRLKFLGVEKSRYYEISSQLQEEIDSELLNPDYSEEEQLLIIKTLLNLAENKYREIKFD